MRIVVDEDFAGQRIDKFLAGIERIGSRARAEKLLEAGLVSIDGRTAIKGNKVQVGYVIELLAGSGVDLAESDDPVMYRPGVVHRLDKDTSGVMVLAKNHLAQRQLQLALRERTATREYLALVHGTVPSRAGRIEAPIGRDVRDSSRRSIDTDFPQDAITHFVVQELLPSTTLLRLKLETGRTHQIRVHLQAIDHPVVADPTYGSSPEFGLERQFLHAAKLSFPHPRTGEPVEVASPLPEDLQAALAAARRQ
jgi:23S rRNA pseudouridine1911/1915/1917 synthase